MSLREKYYRNTEIRRLIRDISARTSHYHRLIATISLVLFSILASLNSLASSKPNLSISQPLNTDQLDQATILSIFRDFNGYAWITSQSGTFHFDGYELTPVIVQSESSEKRITNVTSIAQDSDGIIWIADELRGIQTINQLGREESYTSESYSIPKNTLKIYPKSDNSIWYLSPHELGYHNKENGSSSQVLSSQDISDSFIGLVDGSNTEYFWIYTKNKLLKINSRSKVLTSSIQLPKENEITAATLSEDGRLITADSAGHLYSINTGNTEIQASIRSLATITHLEIHQELLFVGTDEGLYLYDLSLEQVMHLDTDNSKLSNNHITYLLSDDSGLWVGTYHGLNIVNLVDFELYDRKSSSITNEVMGFTQTTDNKIWVATYDGLYQFDSDKGIHTPISEVFLQNILTDKRVMTVSAHKDQIWIGYRRSNLDVISTKSGKKWSLQYEGKSDLEVTSIAHLVNGRSLIGTYNSGLFTTVPSLGSLQLSKIDELGDSSVIIAEEIGGGLALIASEKEIFLFTERGIAPRKLDLAFPSDANDAIILSLKTDKSGKLWIGTRNDGLFLSQFNPLQDSTITLKRARTAGIRKNLSPSIYAIEIDQQGSIWASTSDGILRYSSNGEVIEHFGKVDGLQGNDFNFSSSFIDNRGYLYFGGSNGYNRFNAESVSKKKASPEITLTRVSIAGEIFPIPTSPKGLVGIELDYQGYFFSIDFSVMDFLHPDKNQYRYKLVGFDPKWIENGSKNSATYTNLPPGKYELRVQGADSHGNWNHQGISLIVTVLPPPWETWWAYTVYASIALFLLWWAKKTYDTYILKEKATELAEEMHRTADRAWDHLQDQIDFQQDLLQSASNHYSSSLDIIGESVRHDLKGDTLYLESQKRINVLKAMNSCLHYKGDDLLIEMKSCVNLLTETLLPSATVPPESIITINDIQIGMLNVNLATPLVVVIHELALNALTHAFTQDSPANYLELHLEQLSANDKRYLELRLSDSGSGIRDSANTRSYFGSGLNLVSQIVNNLNGELDISCNDGTKITIKIPMT